MKKKATTKKKKKPAGSAMALLERYIPDRRGKPGVWSEVYEVPVRVLAVVEGYAMVRRKGCAPFVLAEKRVRFVD